MKLEIGSRNFWLLCAIAATCGLLLPLLLYFAGLKNIGLKNIVVPIAYALTYAFASLVAVVAALYLLK